MVISSSPARSKIQEFSDATPSTTSTGFIRRSPAYSMRDMPPPRGSGEGKRVKVRLGPSESASRPNHRRPHYSRFALANQNGKGGFIQDSQILGLWLAGAFWRLPPERIP